MVNGEQLLCSLKERGLLYQKSGDDLADHLDKPRTVYCGFDPTADSLHIGHLIPLLMLKRFQEAGHRPIALVGGATGMIGDPSFKANERQLNSEEIVNEWAIRLESQIKDLINQDSENEVAIENNSNWLADLNVLDFLRDVGKHFSINNLISKESVKQRIDRDGEGISFTEFAYSLVQAMDFAELNRRMDCSVQVGGSDQWGNIVSGIDLNRRQNKSQCYGLTVPLITKADGTKFGKTESGTIWLNAKKTSPYTFYQFWLGVADEDVYRFLRFFTFLSVSAISSIKEKDEFKNAKPVAQSILACEVTRFVHGQDQLDAAKRITDALFTDKSEVLQKEDFEQLALDGLTHITLQDIDISEVTLSRILVDSGLAKSGKEVKDALLRGSILINGELVSPEDSFNLGKLLSVESSAYGNYFLVKFGKKKYLLLSFS
jgi:tyrosyl-tRNA synthetase